VKTEVIVLNDIIGIKRTDDLLVAKMAGTI
jgi:hypothetical protein